MAEAGQEGSRWQQLDPGRRQFDRQGQPIQLPADLRHHAGSRLSQGEARTDGCGPLAEQGDGGRRGHVGHGTPLGGGQVQRRQRQLVLIAQMQRRPAGSQHLEGGTAAQQDGHQVSHDGRQVLAVVKNQEEMAGAQDEGQRFDEGPVARVGDAGGHRDRRRHLAGIAQRSQLDQQHPIGEGAGNRIGHRERQPRLADPTGPRQRQERDGGGEQQGLGGGQLVAPPDQ